MCRSVCNCQNCLQNEANRISHIKISKYQRTAFTGYEVYRPKKTFVSDVKQAAKTLPRAPSREFFILKTIRTKKFADVGDKLGEI